MHDHGLRQQVDAALRHAIALTGPEQYHRDCALILELTRTALNLGLEFVLERLARELLAVGFSHERVTDPSTADRQLMMCLEAVQDILAAQRLSGLLEAVRGMVRWVYVCLADGNHDLLRALALGIETTPLAHGCEDRAYREIH
jgi:hypothetical protein